MTLHLALHSAPKPSPLVPRRVVTDGEADLLNERQVTNPPSPVLARL